jgi:hypothetical protein
MTIGATPLACLCMSLSPSAACAGIDWPQLESVTRRICRYNPYFMPMGSMPQGHVDASIPPAALMPQYGSRCGRTSHATRHTLHVTRHTLHVTRHTSHVTRHTPHASRHTSHVTRHTSHVTHHTSHVTRHTSHITRLTPHASRHTSHVTRVTGHPLNPGILDWRQVK